MTEITIELVALAVVMSMSSDTPSGGAGRIKCAVSGQPYNPTQLPHTTKVCFRALAVIELCKYQDISEGRIRSEARSLVR